MALVEDTLTQPHTNASYLGVLWTCSQASFEAAETQKNQQRLLCLGQWLEWYHRGLGRLLYFQNGRKGKKETVGLLILVAVLDFLA